MTTPTIIELTDLSDPALDVFARLTEAQLRNRLEPEKGIFIAESAKVIDRALTAGLTPVALLMERKWLEAEPELIARCAEAFAAADPAAAGAVSVAVSDPAAAADPAAALPVYTGSRELLAQLTGYEIHRGVLCAMRRPQLPAAEELLARTDARRVVVIDGVVDHTNVGAIFRSAAALNADAVLVTPTTCDPLYRRAVRVSMGTVFQVPWTRTAPDAPAQLRACGFTTAALALCDDSISLADPVLLQQERLALILGTEGDGLARSTIEGCDYTVKIPMAHGVDSLNVAAASAVAMWQLCNHE